MLLFITLNGPYFWESQKARLLLITFLGFNCKHYVHRSLLSKVSLRKVKSDSSFRTL